MTTGTTGTPPNAGGMSVGHFSYRSWNGADGKHEPVPSGGMRLKWNNYSATRITATVTRADFKWLWKHTPYAELVASPPRMGFWYYNGNIDAQWANIPADSAPDNTQKQKVLSKLLEEIKQHDFDLGVDLGQLRQTTSLLSGNLRKLGRAALALKRGDFSTAARQLGARPRGTRLKPSDISGRWLELQYGWLPLLGSSYEAAKAYEAITNGPRTHLFRVSSTRKFQGDFSLIPAHFGCLMTCIVGRRIQYEMYEEMSVVRQLGLVDPLSVAWELTPWSFVVDWFVPVGTYLDLLGQIPSLKGRWLVTDFAKVPKQKPFFIWRDYAFFYPWNTITVLETPSSVNQITKVTRTYSSSPPAVPLPKFKWGLSSSKRFWNAVALAHQRFT